MRVVRIDDRLLVAFELVERLEIVVLHFLVGKLDVRTGIGGVVQVPGWDLLEILEAVVMVLFAPATQRAEIFEGGDHRPTLRGAERSKLGAEEKDADFVPHLWILGDDFELALFGRGRHIRPLPAGRYRGRRPECRAGNDTLGRRRGSWRWGGSLAGRRQQQRRGRSRQSPESEHSHSIEDPLSGVAHYAPTPAACHITLSGQ